MSKVVEGARRALEKFAEDGLDGLSKRIPADLDQHGFDVWCCVFEFMPEAYGHLVVEKFRRLARECRADFDSGGGSTVLLGSIGRLAETTIEHTVPRLRLGVAGAWMEHFRGVKGFVEAVAKANDVHRGFFPDDAASIDAILEDMRKRQ